MKCECTGNVKYAIEGTDGNEATHIAIYAGKYICDECAGTCYPYSACEVLGGEKERSDGDYEPEEYIDVPVDTYEWNGTCDLIEWLHTPEEPVVELVVKVIEVREDEEDPDSVLVTLDAVDVDFTYITVQFPQNEVPFVGEKFTLKLERKYD